MRKKDVSTLFNETRDQYFFYETWLYVHDCSTSNTGSYLYLLFTCVRSSVTVFANDFLFFSTGASTNTCSSWEEVEEIRTCTISIRILRTFFFLGKICKILLEFLYYQLLNTLNQVYLYRIEPRSRKLWKSTISFVES